MSLAVDIALAIDAAEERLENDPNPGTDDDNVYVARALIEPGSIIGSALVALSQMADDLARNSWHDVTPAEVLASYGITGTLAAFILPGEVDA
jgi:hypothetical protein